uniref:Reverse transcriptase domain-containing protein n=1 Tax=Tanacetum cinerariifolium TaxID=118510 RepID=A0A6L2NWG7_TANCI|nr:reverse transcriptase domain-containing protein [Tanacetum cinerariifolium]
MTIKESKDLSSLALNKLIGNLKVHEVVMEKDSKIYRGKKKRIKSIALTAKKNSSDDKTSTSESNDEEYSMIIRTLKSSLEERVNLLGKQEKKRSHSDEGMRRKERVIENVLHAVIQIISLEIVQNHLATKIKRPSLKVFEERSRIDPTLLNNFEMATNGNGDDATNFELKNDMIQQAQNSCQFHGLPSDDANKYFDKFLHVTQSIKVNGVTDNALRLYLFPHSLTHHATAEFDRLPRNSITIFEQMAKMFLEKYFPPSMVTKLRNEISNIRQRPDESLFIAWERYKLLIDRCLNHNMLPVTQIDTFYNWLTLRHRDIINVAAVERKTEVTKDTVPPTNNGSTKDVQPSVVQVETQVPNFKPVVALVVEPIEAPVSAPKPNPKLSIPYPSRLHGQKLSDKANDQKEKFFQIFQDLDFNISFSDALILMPKFGPTIKKKLGDPDKFLILCDFPGMDECLALADLTASINLMPLFVWNKLSLPKLSPTCMTLELTDRSISRSVGVTKDVFIKLGTFHFPTDFVVVDFDADPRVSLILGRSFLKTGRALIDVYKGELTLRVGNKAITFNLDQTLRYSANYDAMLVNQIDLIDVAYEEYSQEVLGFSVNSLLEETDAFLAIDDKPISPEIDDSFYDLEGDIILLKEFLNDDPSSPPLPPQELKVVEPNNDKSSIDEPPVVELKDLPPHLEYAFLEDTQDQEKTTFTSPYGTFAYRRMPFGLCNASGTFQRCMMAIFHDMIEKTIEVFMDDFLVKDIKEKDKIVAKTRQNQRANEKRRKVQSQQKVKPDKVEATKYKKLKEMKIEGLNV